VVLLLSAAALRGQEVKHETVVVTGTYEPVPLEEADRAVGLFGVREQALVAGSIVDFLKLDAALDLRQRAPGDVQADLSIRGGSFGQTLVLLDGQRLNDAQSGHHNLDIPVPLEAVERVEVLRGSGSALYGSDAVGGVVNVITEPAKVSEIRLRTAVGSFGFNQQHGSLTGVFGGFIEQLGFSRDFSSGFAPDRDYRNLALSSLTRWRGTAITLATADKPFGADQFYGNFNSWERTRTWFASIQQKLGGKTDAGFTYRRHTDLFVLYRDRPEIYTNRHMVESWQATLRRREDLARNIRLFYGVEFLADGIVSSNLGRHARNREAGYVSFDARALGRFSFTAGIRDEVYQGRHEASPTVGGGWWLSRRLKLRAGASRAFRVPSYTDLYYHDPANVGSPWLRPERAWSLEAGADWNAGARLRGGITVFERRERDVIDYVRYSPDDLWRATNFQRMRFTGIEASANARLGRRQLLGFSYSGLAGAQALPPGVETKYVFNNPTQAGVVTWQGGLGGWIARTRLGVLERVGRDPYALWDVYLARGGGRIEPFVQAANITATRYQEIPGVIMPRRSFVVGLEYVIRRH
jgi:iron complex outermembrane receptor protein